LTGVPPVRAPSSGAMAIPQRVAEAMRAEAAASEAAKTAAE
jgi:hypothetical protein